MTIADMIKETVDGLPLCEQRKALTFVRKLHAPANIPAKANRKPRPAPAKPYVAKDAAVRAIAGMWKDRTDLPKDPVLAVRAIRARMRSRGRHG